MLPKQLQNDAFGFVRLKPNTKIPFEKEWQKKPYNYIQIQEWINEDNNYGVIGGIGGLIIIDADTEELYKRVFDVLPKTFTVKTSKGFHFYYLASDVTRKYILSKNGIHFGEIISTGSQAVGPNCQHPSGIIYTVERDFPIKFLS
jgi:hypothetical protein